jgi:hypothetical protein
MASKTTKEEVLLIVAGRSQGESPNCLRLLGIVMFFMCLYVLTEFVSIVFVVVNMLACYFRPMAQNGRYTKVVGKGISQTTFEFIISMTIRGATKEIVIDALGTFLNHLDVNFADKHKIDKADGDGPITLQYLRGNK